MRVTMKDIAEATGVSINAVSLALNGRQGLGSDTRRRILEKAKEMGYINRDSRINKAFSSTTICILMRKEHYSRGTFFFYPRVMYGVERSAETYGFGVLIGIIGDEHNLPSFLKENQVCGVIVLGKVDEWVLDKLEEMKYPTVLVDFISSKHDWDCILTGNEFGTYTSTNYLLKKGYRKIGFLGDFSYSNSNRERFFGYQDAMLRFLDMPFHERFEWISRYSILDVDESAIFHHDSSYLAEILKKREIAEAYQCANDTAANTLNNALRILGLRVPEDVAIIGFDDNASAAAMIPKLTTLHIANERMGEKAFHKLLWRLQNANKPPEKDMMSVELIVRDSTPGK